MNNTILKKHASNIALQSGVVLIQSKIILLEASQDKQNGITYLLFSHYNRTYKIENNKIIDVTNGGEYFL